MWSSDKWLLFLSWKVFVGSLLDNGGRLSSVDFAHGISCFLGNTQVTIVFQESVKLIGWAGMKFGSFGDPLHSSTLMHAD